MIIALTAVGLSLNEFSAQRTHDKLSVFPRLIYSFEFNETGAGWVSANVGIGPARLRGFEIIVDGIPLPAETDEGKTPLPDMLVKALGLPPTSSKFTEPRAGDLYEPNHENKLFWLQPGPAEKLILKEWNRVEIKACYCSMYDECWTDSERGPRGEPRRDDNCEDFKNLPKSLWWEG